MALVGAAQYQIVFRHFVGHATLQQLLAAIGCALVLQMIAQIIFGADTRTATSMFTGQYVVFGPFFLSQAQIVAFVVAVAATLGVELLLRAHDLGQGGARGRRRHRGRRGRRGQLVLHQYRRVRACRPVSPASPAPYSSPISRPRPRSASR